MEENKKSREYWEKRARENENKVYKKAGDLKKDLDEHYIKARREIQKSINDLVVRYMDKTELSYVDAMKNLTSSEFKEWKMTLEEYEKEISRLFKTGEEELANKLRIELETLAMKSRITRLDSLKTQIDIELNRKASRDYDVVKKGISDVYRDFYTINTTDFGLTGVNTVLPDKTLRRLLNQPWSGANFSERIWDNTETLGKVLKQEIIQSFIQGISVKDLSDKIQNRFETDRKNTERLVRTELNYALNETTRLSYEEAEIEEYEYLAEIDGRTSDICRELNGQKFKMKDAKVGVNYPPMHPYCRSTTVPVIDYENFGKKKGENKKVEEPKKKETKKIIEKPKKENDIIKEKNVFIKAKTIEEANEFAIKNLGINADYNGIDIKCANEWNEGLFNMKEKFPDIVKEGINFVGATQSRNELLKKEIMDFLENAYIEEGYTPRKAKNQAKKDTEYYTMNLRINPREMAVSLSLKNKATNNPLTLIIKKYTGITMNNEFFNDYENAIANKIEQVKKKWKPIGCGTVKGTFDHEFGHQIDKFLKINENEKIINLYEKLSKDELEENLSGYSATNINEFIAEAWSEYANNSNPRNISKTVGSLIEKEWEKWKKEKK